MTATLDPQGVGWPVQLPDGWTRTSATTATYVVRFDHVSCTPVTPADPTVTQATCTDGAVTEPTIVLPEVSGVTFSIDPSDLGDGSQDREVAVCVGGVVAVPTLALVDTDGITSTADPAGPYAPGATVTVTAMLDPAGVAWPDQLPAGWTRASDTTATYTVGFDRVSCLPVVPVAPTVTQATCLIGAVTATVDDGFGWGTITPPWTRVDDTTATLPLLLEGASCDEVAPVAPAVTEAVCSRGVVSAPTLAVVDTAGVTDAVDPPGPYSPGQTVTVTATLDPAGVAWPAALPAGWTRASDTPATYVATFDDVACDLGAPVAPTVIQATCTGGEVTQPTIVLPRSYGISYAVDPAPPTTGRATPR